MTTPAHERAKKKALDGALRGLFVRLHARPTPDQLLSVVDQLDAGEQAPLRKLARR